MVHMVRFERARLISRNKIMYVAIHNWISKIVSRALWLLLSTYVTGLSVTP